MRRLKNFAGKIINSTFSPTATKVVLILLMLVNVAGAVSYGMEGDVKGTWNCLNWIMWIGIVLGYQILMERTTEKLDLQKTYIESLESYKTLSDDQVQSLKELVEAYKNRCEGLEEQVENYRKLTEMNDEIIKKLEAQVESYEKLAKMDDKIIKKKDAIIEQYKSNKPSRF